ncbi:hypothetical protein HYW94_00165 [Candidatus Uhrbacteria bacterium]|nr:hypothetical protein [Candidatus Uhrbacteria bacterium]
MQKNPNDSKNIAYKSIVIIGFIFILLLWLPSFVASFKSMTQAMNQSASQITREMDKQSGVFFKDTEKKINEGLQKLEQEKQKQDALQEKVTDILKESIRVAPLQTASSSETIIQQNAASSSTLPLPLISNPL